MDADNARIGNIVGFAQKLLDQLRTALTDGDRAVSAVACMRIGAENHSAAACIHFAHIAVNYGLMCRNKFAAVFFCRGQTEHMIVFIDRAADGAQGVVAVGQHIGKRKLLKTGGTGCLNDTDIGNVMRRHRVEFHFQRPHISGSVMGRENPVSDRLFAAVVCVAGSLTFGDQLAAEIEHSVIVNLYHEKHLRFS